MRKWYPAVLVALSFVASLVVYPRLPDRVPNSSSPRHSSGTMSMPGPHSP